MKTIMVLMYIVVFCNFNKSQSQVNDYPEMNVFERIYDELSRFIDIPSLKLNTTNVVEERVIIDYKTSYENAKSQILLYRAYMDCTRKVDESFTPIMKLITNEKDTEKVIEVYSEYINRLLDHIFKIKHACLPPPRIKLPVFKTTD